MEPQKAESKRFKAAVIYTALPAAQKFQVDDFLPYTDRCRLLQTIKEKNFSSAMFTTSDIYLLSDKSLPSEASGSARTFAVVNLLLMAISFLTENLVPGISYALYALVGTIILNRKSATYWKMRFIPARIDSISIILSVVSYAFIILCITFIQDGFFPPSPSHVLILQACLFAPFFEELLFRDYIFNTFLFFPKNRSAEAAYILPIMTSSLTFALVHVSWGLNMQYSDLAVYMTAGILLGVIRWQTRSLFFPVLVHIAVNTTILFA